MNTFSHVHGFAGYISIFAHLSYPSIFLALIASGHVIPIPEGATLILLGYLAGIGARSLFGLYAIGAFSVLFFDMLMYTISRSGSKLAEKLLKKVKTHILERYHDASNAKTLSLVVISHFVPGWRFANPIIAGVAKVEWHKFLFFTLISSLIYAPLYISIGYFFHTRVFYVLSIFQSLNRNFLPFSFIGMGVGILVYVVILERRKRVYNKHHHAEE